MTLADAHDSLAKAGHVFDTETSKRDFINQWTGQYNKKAQNGLISVLRDTGFGPFATAASTMTSRGIRILSGSPSVEGTSLLSSARLRLEVLGKLAAITAGVAAMNYAKWGRLDGMTTIRRSWP